MAIMVQKNVFQHHLITNCCILSFDGLLLVIHRL